VIGTPGWYPDPSGRFEHRFHNGAAWTADVATDGHRFVDTAATAAFRDSAGPAPPMAPRRSNGLATASMVCGIVAVSLGWVPFVAVPMIAVAVVALALGVAGLRRSRSTGTGRSFAVSGLLTGGAGLGACAVGVVLTGAFLDAVRAYADAGPHSVELTSCRRDGGQVIAEGTITNEGTGPATFAILVEADAGEAGGRGGQRAIVDDLAPGAAERFTVTVPRTRFADSEPECHIVDVNGPLPFGIDLADFD